MPKSAKRVELIVEGGSAFEKVEFDVLEELIASGGQVDRQDLPARMRAAHYLACLKFDKKIVGAAGIKNNPRHQQTVAGKAGVDLPTDRFLGELGWLIVHREFTGRKFGDLLITALLGAAGKQNLFATIRSTNLVARALHERFGFRHVGVPWQADGGDDMVLLYIRLAA